MTMQLHLQDVPARNGRLWVRHGFKVFQRQPLALAGLFGLYLFVVLRRDADARASGRC